MIELQKIIKQFQAQKAIMQQTSPEKLLQKFGSPQKIKFLSESLNHSMIKASKQVYNLSTRNIKKFIREQRQMELKRKQEVVNLKKNLNQKKKYDENQLMELQFRMVKTQHDPVYIQKCKTQSSEIASIGEKRNKRRTTNKINSRFNVVEVPQNNKTVMNRPKIVSVIQPHPNQNFRQQISSETLPRIIGIRKKSKSTFQKLSTKVISKDFDIGSKLRISNLEVTPEQLQKSPPSIVGSSNKIIGKKNTSVLYANQQEKFINITEDKMMKYIKNLHTLVNGCYQYGEPLNEQTISKLLLQRYSIQKGKASTEADLTTIQVESKTFKLPYSEFISESQTRKSIHRILNMSVKTAQRVTFQLLDLNKNGYIDEKDIIDLAELSMKIPEIKSDFLKIVRYMKTQQSFSISNAQSNSYRQDSYLQMQKLKDISVRYLSIQAVKTYQNGPNNTTLKKNNSRHQRSHTYSTSQFTQQQISKSTIKNDNSNLSSCQFNKKKFYSFIESKKNFFNNKKIKQREKFKFSLNFQEFSQIFGEQRPLAFYDIVKFLFGVKKQDLEHSELGQLSQRLKKENETKIKPKEETYEHKNYNIPQIIKDFQRRFACDIEVSKYEQVLNLGKLSLRQDSIIGKQKQEQQQKQRLNQRDKQRQ